MSICISCGKKSDTVTKFQCPKCGKIEIIRCQKCKETSKTYKCPECGFVGP
jgi:predicted RNA-binding Zn-ribbon protein involved in translation (DUF1610 family)